MADDPHTGFILAAYAVTAMIVGGLILRAVVDQRAQMRALAELDRRGVTRSRPPLAVRNGGQGAAEGV